MAGNPFDTIDARLSNIENILLDLKHASTNTDNKSETEKLLTIKEAGEFLHLSIPTLYSYVSRSAIPVSKQGKRLYFSKKDLTEWVKTGRKQTHSEIKAEAHTYISVRKNINDNFLDV